MSHHVSGEDDAAYISHNGINQYVMLTKVETSISNMP